MSSFVVQPMLLRFTEDKFMLAEPEKKNPAANAIWPYEKIEQVIVRARHLHLDIK